MVIEHILDHQNSAKTIPLTDGSMILIDKPLHWTSFDVVNKIRFAIKHAFGVKKIKVGHAGTLDPLATGLLLVCTGAYTKKIDELQNQNKSYTGEIRLGAITPTYDSESEPEQYRPVPALSLQDLEETVSHFTGDILQIPPIYSAIKINGKKAYQLARRGEEAELKPRSINIARLELVLQEKDVLRFDVTCSKGTYIRSLAHDIGNRIGCGAYLASLRRETIEDFNVRSAMTVDEVVAYIQNYSQRQND